MKLNNAAAAGLERKANRFSNGVKQHDAKAEVKKIFGKSEELTKREGHAPAYGETKPHLDHKSMMKLPASEHHRLETAHSMHAMDAEDKGDHTNAAKHKDAA